MNKPDVIFQKTNLSYNSEFKRFYSVFEQQLVQIGLGEEQLNNQTALELTQSLERVNEAIQTPTSFGTIKLRMSPELGGLVIARSDSSFHVEVGILPLLLERKKIILSRLKTINQERKIENLRDLISTVPDIEIKSKLDIELSSLEAEAIKIKEEVKELEQEQIRSYTQSQAELAQLNFDLFEKKSKVFRSFLEKESVATIIGSLLLFVITISIIVSMFLQKPTSEIINNAFLVILGYFFGQIVRNPSNT